MQNIANQASLKQLCEWNLNYTNVMRIRENVVDFSMGFRWGEVMDKGMPHSRYKKAKELQ